MPDDLMAPIPPLDYPSSAESIEDLIEHRRLHAERAGKSKSRANKLGHMRKRIRAQIFLMEDGGVAERECKAEADERYLRHLELMEEAETCANIAEARKEALTMRYEMWRTRSANKRAEQSL